MPHPCFIHLYALRSQRYDISKYSEYQLKKTEWLTNQPSNLSRETKKHIPYRKLLCIEKSRNDYALA